MVYFIEIQEIVDNPARPMINFESALLNHSKKEVAS